MPYDYGVLDKEVRNWAMWCHLAGLAGFTGIPFANIIAPFIVWIMKRNAHPFIDRQGREALNFQISITLYLIISIFLGVIFVGLVFIIIIPVIAFVFTIIAAIKAKDGKNYRYPFTIRLID